MKQKLGHLFVISAPSGTGKTTLVRRIIREIPHCVRSVSATTRGPRPNETDHVDYHFLKKDEFRRWIREGRFFEWEEVHGSLYGTPRDSLEAGLKAGEDLVLDIDVRGALSVRKVYGDRCTLIFLKTSSPEELEARLRGRRTEPEVLLQRRLEAARKELAEQNNFDYVIVNDGLEKAFQEVKTLIGRIRAQHDSSG